MIRQRRGVHRGTRGNLQLSRISVPCFVTGLARQGYGRLPVAALKQ
jgi:hypothetical protein